MNRVFISSPYSATNDSDLGRNITYARLCIAHSFELKEAPWASHLLYTQQGVLDDTDPAQRALGIQAALEWLAIADLVAFYVDWGWSPGMITELKAARMFKRDIAVRKLYEFTSTHLPPEFLEA